jgi:hypothetical protein
MNYQQKICGALNETFGAAVSDQTAIIQRRHKIKLIEELFKAWEDLGRPKPNYKDFDAYWDMSNIKLIIEADSLSRELHRRFLVKNGSKFFDGI